MCDYSLLRFVSKCIELLYNLIAVLMASSVGEFGENACAFLSGAVGGELDS